MLKSTRSGGFGICHCSNISVLFVVYAHTPGMNITPPRFPPYLYSQTQRLIQRLNDLGETFLYKSSRTVHRNQTSKLEVVPSLLRSLLGGNGLGRVFPAGVRPGSPWRGGDAFLLPHYSVDHSVVLRWRLNWVETMVFVTKRRSSILIDWWLNSHISWSQRSSPWSHKCSGAQRKTMNVWKRQQTKTKQLLLPWFQKPTKLLLTYIPLPRSINTDKHQFWKQVFITIIYRMTQ